MRIAGDFRYPDQAEKLWFKNVLALINGKWFVFPSLSVARQVVPLDGHRAIFVDAVDLQVRLSDDNRDLWNLAETHEAKDGRELWAKLLTSATDVYSTYEWAIDGRKKYEKPRFKEFKRKKFYQLVYDRSNVGHWMMYSRLHRDAKNILKTLHNHKVTEDKTLFSEKDIVKYFGSGNASWRIFHATIISYGLLKLTFV